MSEMLGNQYFLTRKYHEALSELETSLKKNPTSKPIRKKLIICYVKTGKLYTALEIFEKLIVEDVYCIINTDPILDDCPCPEIIYELENASSYFDEKEKSIALGILWLYCDIKHSLNHFILLSLKDKRFEKIVELLRTKTKQTQR
ncbi:MAG: tetratricopeptide repeat protein [Ignavibacteriales bacterium]|nr:tetratricopeptide repeat protein [Ignavibacteriales bacterium]